MSEQRWEPKVGERVRLVDDDVLSFIQDRGGVVVRREGSHVLVRFDGRQVDYQLWPDELAPIRGEDPQDDPARRERGGE
jgi:hypothetical protein